MEIATQIVVSRMKDGNLQLKLTGQLNEDLLLLMLGKAIQGVPMVLEKIAKENQIVPANGTLLDRLPNSGLKPR